MVPHVIVIETENKSDQFGIGTRIPKKKDELDDLDIEQRLRKNDYLMIFNNEMEGISEMILQHTSSRNTWTTK